MRFKKGCKVEVLNKREVPSGSWWCAEIISGNGHTYSVRYDCYSPDINGAVERVPRKAIRPCPPPVKMPRSWAPGDIAEVFGNDSWKLAEVSRVVARNYYFVRLLGSSREFRVHISDLRVRQSWQDNIWVVIQKDSGRCSNGLMTSQTKTIKFSSQLPKSHAGNNNGFAEDTSTSMKKRPLPVDTFTGASRKMRIVQKDGRCQRIIAGHSSQLLEKVDAVASPCKVLGEKYMHATLNDRFCELGTDKRKSLADVGYHFIGSVEPDDAESVSSSVGSCSPSVTPYRSLHYPLASSPHDLDNHFNDAESSCASGRDFSPHAKEALGTKVHHLELHAYRSTILALYASGPLTWEQEALMTSLRLMLHISNDEHLSELRHLASAKTDILHSFQDTVPSLLWAINQLCTLLYFPQTLSRWAINQLCMLLYNGSVVMCIHGPKLVACKACHRDRTMAAFLTCYTLQTLLQHFQCILGCIRGNNTPDAVVIHYLEAAHH